jgi:hypothetical protein
MGPDMRERNIFCTRVDDFDLDKIHQLFYSSVTYFRGFLVGEAQ